MPNWLDILLGFILALSILGGFAKGIARTGIGFAAVIVGILCGLWFYGSVGAMMIGFIGSRPVANLVGFLAIFVSFLSLRRPDRRAYRKAAEVRAPVLAEPAARGRLRRRARDADLRGGRLRADGVLGQAAAAPAASTASSAPRRCIEFFNSSPESARTSSDRPGLWFSSRLRVPVIPNQLIRPYRSVIPQAIDALGQAADAAFAAQLASGGARVYMRHGPWTAADDAGPWVQDLAICWYGFYPGYRCPSRSMSEELGDEVMSGGVTRCRGWAHRSSTFAHRVRR